MWKLIANVAVVALIAGAFGGYYFRGAQSTASAAPVAQQLAASTIDCDRPEDGGAYDCWVSGAKMTAGPVLAGCTPPAANDATQDFTCTIPVQRPQGIERTVTVSAASECPSTWTFMWARKMLVGAECDSAVRDAVLAAAA